MPLKFSNSSMVRDQLLNGTRAEYSVATKATNGPSAVSNSLLRVNQKANPNNYQWNKSKSAANTFTVSKKNAAASKANFLNVRQTYKNGWVNATVALNSYKEDLEMINNAYKSKVTEIINTKFMNPDSERFAELVDYIEGLNEITLDLFKQNMTKVEADIEMNNIYIKAEESLDIKKEYFKSVYPAIAAEYMALVKLKKRAKKARNSVLQTLKARIKP